MIYPTMTLIFAVAGFFAVIVCLAFSPVVSRRITVIVAALAAAAALVLYGLGIGGLATTPAEAFTAAIRVVFMTIRIFGGREFYSDLCNAAPWFVESVFLQGVFWLMQTAATFATVSAIFSTVGKQLLRRMRSFTLPFGKVCMIYGLNERSVKYAGSFIKLGYRPVFIESGTSGCSADEVDAVGGAVWKESAVTADGSWLSKLGIRPGGKRLEIVCAGNSDGESKAFLTLAVGGMKRRGISTSQIHICVLCEAEANFDFLSHIQLEPGKYIAADVYSSGYLTARRLISSAGPWRMMDFGKNAQADGDFRAMIVGFGSRGQNLLRLLVQNGQFLGSRFSAIVVDSDIDRCSGVFRTLYADMIGRYNIEFVQADARSESFASILEKATPSLRYIALCTGGDAVTQQASDLIRMYRLCRPDRFPRRMVLAVCGRDKVTICGTPSRPYIAAGADGSGQETDIQVPVVQPSELLLGRTDQLARNINSIYLKNSAEKLYPGDREAQEEYYRNGWYGADFISRMSCRAAAAAIPAMLAAAGGGPDSGMDPAAVRKLVLDDPALIDALSQMEHLRWNAFESSTGVVRMPAEEFEKRASAAEAGAAESLKKLERLQPGGENISEAERIYADFRRELGRVRREIPSCGVGGIHVCLTDWEALVPLWKRYEPLDELDRRMQRELARIRMPAGNEGPGPELPAAVDFQRLDTENVLGILDLICGGRG